MNRSAPANAATSRAATQPTQAGEGMAGTSRSRSDGRFEGGGGTSSSRAVVLMRLVGEDVPAALDTPGQDADSFPSARWRATPLGRTGRRAPSARGRRDGPGGCGGTLRSRQIAQCPDRVSESHGGRAGPSVTGRSNSAIPAILERKKGGQQ